MVAVVLEKVTGVFVDMGTTDCEEKVAVMILLVNVLEDVFTSVVWTGKPVTNSPGRIVTLDMTADGGKLVVVMYVELLTERFATANMFRLKYIDTGIKPPIGAS
jgi:hypothetical protein